LKRIVISGAVLALALTGMGTGTAAPATTKITGGGQTLVPAGGGAGDTVGFNAQVTGDEVKGQFQYVKRNGLGTGQNQEVSHGDVTCALVLSRPDEGGAGGVAVFGGALRDGTPFRVDVTDNGQGAQGSDMILVQTGDAALDGDDDGEDTEICDQEDEESLDLNRGNVTIHKTK
jgi:hypothetical protein